MGLLEHDPSIPWRYADIVSPTVKGVGTVRNHNHVIEKRKRPP
jgi:hypothetical protein